jgi:hypothetical protein
MYALDVELPASSKEAEKAAIETGKGQKNRSSKPLARRNSGRDRPRNIEDGKKTKTLSQDQLKYKDLLDKLSGSSKAQMLDSKGSVIGETPVRDLAELLKKSSNNIKTLVFDGIITQRLVDIAAQKGVSTIVGSKWGNVSKQLTSMEILTKNDLS